MMKLAPYRVFAPYACTVPPVSTGETINRSAICASRHTRNSLLVHSVYGRGGHMLNLTSNVFLLIALFVIVLVLPACDARPSGNEPNVFDASDEDDELFV